MSPEQIEAWVDAAAAGLALPLDPAHRPGTLRYFALAAEMARLVEGLPLGPADEPAEHFEPIAPRSSMSPDATNASAPSTGSGTGADAVEGTST